MKSSTFTKLTLCLALLISLTSCGSEKNDEKKPQENQQDRSNSQTDTKIIDYQLTRCTIRRDIADDGNRQAETRPSPEHTYLRE